MRPNLPFLSAASNALLQPGGLLRWKKRLVKDAGLSLPFTEVMKIDRLTSPLLDVPRQSLPRPRLRHGRRPALSPKSNPKSVRSLLRSIAGSPSSSSSSPNCSSPRESASVYAAYLRSHFSFLSQRPCVAEPEATSLSSAEPRALWSSLVLLLSLLSRGISCGYLQPLLIHCHWSRQSCLSHAKASSSLWHGFSSSHLQSFLVFTFLSFHLEDIFYYSHTQDGKTSRLSCFLPANLSHLLRIKAV